MKTFVINLERSKDRRAYAKNQLDKFNVEYEFFKATDGSTLSDEWIENNLDESFKKEYEKYKNRFITKGALGCADSHRRLWKYILENEINEEIFLILEDDFFLLKDTMKIINEIASVMKQHDLEFVNLYYTSLEILELDKKNSIKVNNKYSLYKYPNQKTSNSLAYLVNKKGLKKLLSSQSSKITRMADDWDFEEISLNAWLVYPLPIVTSGFTSTIVNMNFKTFVKRMILQKILWIPIISNILIDLWKKRIVKVRIK
ncbi:glycosyltransferase family 25 protein [Caminibacter mediatlanticus]|uniref:Glycosyl transferase family 25 domain-containing protein n=1 Tax=Caminibacter mediatlanticus TB-2 TaxID=391592 RepID=A0AAI9AG45_9BACT|nr:glycosyltransferase family 25 protein [Caminibacter mediatlanticus]EDM22996.1 hypothetical protein CMTB2_04337 [Caminibacter mediatlanticus TB-2]